LWWFRLSRSAFTQYSLNQHPGQGGKVEVDLPKGRVSLSLNQPIVDQAGVARSKTKDGDIEYTKGRIDNPGLVYMSPARRELFMVCDLNAGDMAEFMIAGGHLGGQYPEFIPVVEGKEFGAVVGKGDPRGKAAHRGVIVDRKPGGVALTPRAHWFGSVACHLLEELLRRLDPWISCGAPAGLLTECRSLRRNPS